MRITGSCHCGRIAFQLDGPPDLSAISARACSCSFCTKHGGVWTSWRTGTLDVEFKDESRVSRYRFGTGTAVFHVCSECGAVPLVTSEIDGRTYAVVNVNTFEGLDPSTIRREPVSFDGEGETDRLARRTRNWIADVRLRS